MTSFRELRIVEGSIRHLEVGAAVLPIGVEKERVEPSIEVVVMGNVLACPITAVELLQPSLKIPGGPLRPHPAWRNARAILGQCESKQISDRALIKH